MAEIHESIFSIIATALICGIICSMVQSTSLKELIHLLCSLFFAIAIILPLTSIEPEKLLPDLDLSAPNNRQPTSDGEELAQQAMAEIIKQKTETYILDKAQRMNISVRTTVHLNENLQPSYVEIIGQPDFHAKQILSEILEQDLGIPKEDQQWIG